MREEAESGPIPALLLVGAGALVGFAMLAVAIGRTEDIGITRLPAANAVASVSLTVQDRPDGAILLRDANTQSVIETVEPGHDGFLRATLRGFAQARLRSGLTPAEPFRLTRYDDGTLALADETTGRRVNLEAFGASNAQAFARLLPSGSVAR